MPVVGGGAEPLPGCPPGGGGPGGSPPVGGGPIGGGPIGGGPVAKPLGGGLIPGWGGPCPYDIFALVSLMPDITCHNILV